MSAGGYFDTVVCDLFLFFRFELAVFETFCCFVFVGFPVMMGVLREERDDVEMVCYCFLLLFLFLLLSVYCF